jgi:hypothetical protein
MESDDVASVDLEKMMWEALIWQMRGRIILGCVASCWQMVWCHMAQAWASM